MTQGHLQGQGHSPHCNFLSPLHGHHHPSLPMALGSKRKPHKRVGTAHSCQPGHAPLVGQSGPARTPPTPHPDPITPGLSSCLPQVLSSGDTGMGKQPWANAGREPCPPYSTDLPQGGQQLRPRPLCSARALGPPWLGQRGKLQETPQVFRPLDHQSGLTRPEGPQPGLPGSQGPPLGTRSHQCLPGTRRRQRPNPSLLKSPEPDQSHCWAMAHLAALRS